MALSQDQFFKAVATRRIPRVRIAGIVVNDGAVLVQRPVDDPSSCYAFIGGEYEVGDTFESRLRKEFEEETNARIVDAAYLFCVENHFRYKGHIIQQAEHYFSVKLDRSDVASREYRLQQHWLPLDQIGVVDLRPLVVRDALADGSYLRVKHIIQLLEDEAGKSTRSD
ncbi:NUDIX domain-containing protein [Roseibium aggregatum]|uniref:NUDIX domain-containing protein n=1 Tax=Roseibium aggregatum TaxID=187304 RepID=UPI001E58CC1F|nr:NUDIX domain-containing protein [Roseibium aggregatum]